MREDPDEAIRAQITELSCAPQSVLRGTCKVSEGKINSSVFIIFFI